MEEIKLELKPLIRKLLIPSKKEASSEFAGGYGSIFKGHGLEFTGFRTYTLSDDANLIDWKASLRANNLLIREFTEERNLNIFFLMDVSDSMLFSSIEKLKCEYAAELLASLSFVALGSDDNVGLAMFNDKIVSIIPVGKGHKQYFLIKKAISNPKLYGGAFDLNRSLKYVMTYLKRNSILIIISDFFGLKGDWIKHLKVAASKYSVFGICVRDRLDKELPRDSGQVLFSDPFSEEKKIILPDRIKDEYRLQTEKQLKDIRDVFSKSNSNFLELSTDEPFVKPVTKFFRERAKRWR